MAAVSSSIRRGGGVQVAERRVGEAGHQRPQALVILGLGGGGGRAQGAAVETALEGDDLVAVLGRAVQPDQLDGRLVGLGARVAEERLPAETPLRKGLGPEPLQLGVPGVGDVDQLAQLVADGLDDRRRAMAQQVAAPAGEEVEIAVALAVPHPGVLAADQGDGKASVVGDHVALKELEDFLGIHRASGRHRRTPVGK